MPLIFLRLGWGNDGRQVFTDSPGMWMGYVTIAMGSLIDRAIRSKMQIQNGNRWRTRVKWCDTLNTCVPSDTISISMLVVCFDSFSYVMTLDASRSSSFVSHDKLQAHNRVIACVNDFSIKDFLCWRWWLGSRRSLASGEWRIICLEKLIRCHYVIHITTNYYVEWLREVIWTSITAKTRP